MSPVHATPAVLVYLPMSNITGKAESMCLLFKIIKRIVFNGLNLASSHSEYLYGHLHCIQTPGNCNVTES